MGSYAKIAFTPSMLGWDDDSKFTVRDLYLHEDLGTFSGEFGADVFPSDVEMFKIAKV